VSLTQVPTSTKTIQRKRKILGLQSAVQLQASFETISPYIIEIRERFPDIGARQIRTMLLQSHSMKVPE
jgi:hypothetical protein